MQPVDIIRLCLTLPLPPSTSYMTGSEIILIWWYKHPSALIPRTIWWPCEDDVMQSRSVWQISWTCFSFTCVSFGFKLRWGNWGQQPDRHPSLARRFLPRSCRLAYVFSITCSVTHKQGISHSVSMSMVATYKKVDVLFVNGRSSGFGRSK